MNQAKMILKSQMENIKYARSAGVMFFHELNLTLAEASEVKTIISEAVTNAIIHGYKRQCDEEFELNLAYDETQMIMEIIDYGIGIKDIEKARMPMYTTLEEEERSGIGFTIMELFSDKLEIISTENKGTTIIATKYYGKNDKT